jgi:CRISPR-associated protein Cas1
VLTRRGGRLVAFRDGTMTASAPLTQISEVVLTGAVTVTTAAMHTLLRQGVPMILLTGTGRPLGRLEPPTAPHIAARQRQLALTGDPQARVDAARAIVAGKIRNQQALLRRRARRSSDPDGVWAAAAKLAALEERVAEPGPTTGVAGLLGIEGAAAGAYYRALRLIIEPSCRFAGRDQRATDPTNVLTNYCSALLRETVNSAILVAGLDPYLSFLHTPMRGRPTLAFDLMEEWRPVLLDSTVVALLGLRAVTSEDIAVDDGMPVLSAAARAHAVTRFHARLAAPARGWPTTPAGRTYQQQLYLQCRVMRDWILGERPTYEPFQWR